MNKSKYLTVDRTSSEGKHLVVLNDRTKGLLGCEVLGKVFAEAEKEYGILYLISQSLFDVQLQCLQTPQGAHGWKITAV
ncbi:hypothetical protein SUGI_1158740 [Cryptomeria japonica]|nr:hypothetical protein SUGI_1158740 [Cryptomeria japonica]